MEGFISLFFGMFLVIVLNASIKNINIENTLSGIFSQFVLMLFSVVGVFSSAMLCYYIMDNTIN